MMRRSFLLLLLACACSEEEQLADGNISEPSAIAPPAAQIVKAATPEPAPEEMASVEAGSAAELLLHYYRLIAERRYREAWRLREAGGPDVAQLAAAYAGYDAISANVGTPSEPATAGEWTYVEVPVQTYGRMKDGRPFSSAGTVTLRRPAQGGEWRIHGG